MGHKHNFKFIHTSEFAYNVVLKELAVLYLLFGISALFPWTPMLNSIYPQP